MRKTAFTSLVFFLATACGGGSTPEPSTPVEQAEDTGEASESEEEEAEGSSVEEVEPEVPSGPEGPTGGRTPKDMVGAESTRFVLSFNRSDIGMKAEERCDSQHSSDPKKRSQCMKSARSVVKEDVLQFQEGAGRWVWTTSNQKGNSLRPLRKTNFTWGEETKNSIEIKPSKGAKVVIEVPNNYSIVLPHPTHGKLVYDAKLSE